MCIISMYSVLNILSEYTYVYISKDITSCTFAACFENCRKSSVYPKVIRQFMMQPLHSLSGDNDLLRLHLRWRETRLNAPKKSQIFVIGCEY